MLRKILKLGPIVTSMFLFIPISIFCATVFNNLTLTFITAILAIIPLAILIGILTREISLQSNAAMSGLVSATFGNAIELIVSIFALKEGLVRVVQASIIGSIIGNILLLTGLSIFFGGLKYKYQNYNKEAAGVSSTMLLIVFTGLAIPSVFAIVSKNTHTANILSDFVAIILAIIYIAGLVFSLKTHKDLYDATDDMKHKKEKPTMTKQFTMVMLFFTTVLVAIEAELLVKGIKEGALSLGMTETFIGVVIIAIVTNIAEKGAAIKFARENKIDLSLEIGLSSAIQVALFVVPILVFVSQVFNQASILIFSMFEIIAVFVAVLIINDLATDGKCNWLEGAQLVTVYLIIATAFFFL